MWPPAARWTAPASLACWQTLARAGDLRAADWLARAHRALLAQADAISDATLRQGFLQNIPHHREILAAWAQRNGPAESLAFDGLSVCLGVERRAAQRRPGRPTGRTRRLEVDIRVWGATQLTVVAVGLGQLLSFAIVGCAAVCARV